MKQYLNNKQQGVGLIEVVISLFLISIAILSHTQLIAQSIRYNNSSVFQTHANQLIQEYSTLVQLNSEAAKTDAYNIGYSDTFTLPSPNCYSTALCNSAELAATERYFWLLKAQKQLPGGKVLISHSSGDVIMTLLWNPDGRTIPTLTSPNPLTITCETGDDKYACIQAKITL